MTDLIPADQFETILYEVRDGVAWVTLNRPEVHNAFNRRMEAELQSVWRAARGDDDVRCIVLTGAGEKAFCTGIDRNQNVGNFTEDPATGEKKSSDGHVAGSTPWHFNDPGDHLGPKANDLWKPVIAAVNGMACGGAFYMLGEVDFIIASDNATFFDPHVSYGMTACFEPIQISHKMPFHEIMRISLMGAHERMTAERAYQIGFVTEVVPQAELREAAGRAAQIIANNPPIPVQGTVRALWMAMHADRRTALDLGRLLILLGTDADSVMQGQKTFMSGERVVPRLR